MEAYNKHLVPAAFGLVNTGAICYFNSFLQVLAGCPSFTKAVLANSKYLSQTKTGVALCLFVVHYSTQSPETSQMTSNILSALVADLAIRRQHVRFGSGQESASEVLLHLLDMLEPSKLPGDPVVENPITRLFLHRFRCDITCRACKKEVSKTTDYAVNFNLFHIDQMIRKPSTVAEFSRAIRIQVSLTEDYSCALCPCPTCGSTTPRTDEKCQNCGGTNMAKSTATRVYSLSMIPEIVFCMFNLYGESTRIARYFPDRLEFPASSGGVLNFRIVGQVEHAGSLSGGHYWARGLRQDGDVYTLNDTGVYGGSKFESTPNTYIVVYHYESTTAAEA
jgi:uncharacterized UBP type Zn finger protein